MAIVKAPENKTVGVGLSELEFKAEYFHNLLCEHLKQEGKHWISFHNNPMMSPPPLRGDGKSRCDQCFLGMSPYAELPERNKHFLRDIVLSIPKAEAAWRNRV